MSVPGKRSRVKRAAGILCPVSAVPNRDGRGDFGPDLKRWLDWLQSAGLRYWQILPLTNPDAVGSPYASSSSLAGSWTYISLAPLVQRGLVLDKVYRYYQKKVSRRTYNQNLRRKWEILLLAFDTLQSDKKSSNYHDWQNYCRRNQAWLDPVSTWLALSETFHHRPWWTWPKSYRRYPITSPLTTEMNQRRNFYQFLQLQFDAQWRVIRKFAHDRGIHIIGDLPFYMQLDSADVWMRPDLFILDSNNRPTAVAGVPPDIFTRRGQRWGNPVYRWSAHRAERYQWWVQRLQMWFTRYDLIRFDHFRGFIATWHIPRLTKNPAVGRWVASPGHELLKTVFSKFPARRAIAEDLGVYTPLVKELRQDWGIPATRVWQFGWSGLPHNLHHVDEIRQDAVLYTSTHDTNTVVGWWRRDAKWYERMHVRERGRVEPPPVHWRAIEDCYDSPARLAMVTPQDLLGLGHQARLNRPGTPRNNWDWQVPPRSLTPSLALRIRRLARIAGRLDAKRRPE